LIYVWSKITIHAGVVDSRRRAAAADKRRSVQQQLNASQRAQYAKDGSQAPAYMSVKCDNRSPYPYAVSVGPGARMLPCAGLQYNVSAAGGEGDAYSLRSNVDNEYAYVDELLAPPSTSHHQSPSRDYTSTTSNNNNAYAPRARQSVPDHVTGCLLACRQFDVAPDDRPRVDAGNN